MSQSGQGWSGYYDDNTDDDGMTGVDADAHSFFVGDATPLQPGTPGSLPPPTLTDHLLGNPGATAIGLLVIGVGLGWLLRKKGR